MSALTINTENTFFIADSHFSHTSVMHKAQRPFESVEEMDEFLITCWNKIVRKNSHVWHLGDFGFGTVEHQRRIFDRLNGVKHLLVGNHDKSSVARADFGWASVDQIRVLKAGDLKIVCCHYPMREWPDYFRNTVHFHGHTHNNIPSSRRSFDVGMDNAGYTPQTLAQLQLRMAELPDLDFRQGEPAKPRIDPLADIDDETAADPHP